MLFAMFRPTFLFDVLVVVGVDAQLDEASVQLEDIIVSQWRHVSADEKHQLHKQIDDILRPHGLETRLLVVDRANSIALYFVCMTLSALMSLRAQWKGGQLTDIVESLFAVLSGTMGSRVKRLTWPDTDYERCAEFLNSLQGKPKI